MVVLYSAFILGLLGSMHCVGMCGPLLMALPFNKEGKKTGMLIYHLGRILCYGCLGLLTSVLGISLQSAGVHEKISLGAGIVLLVGLLLFYLGYLNIHRYIRSAYVLNKIKEFWQKFMQTQKWYYLFVIGFLNGMLPCGLVYVALGFTLVFPDNTLSFYYMVAFGLGTLPALLAVGFFSRFLHVKLRKYVQYLVPITTAISAILLIIRGLSLDIPYLSPLLAVGNCCH